MTRSTPNSRGFTIIELLIAVLVVAVLAALAYPSFLDSIKKGRRADAFSAIAAVQQAQERFRSNNPAFSSTLSALGLTATSPAGRYDMALSATSATGYEVTATGKSGTSQASDGSCVRLRVTVTGGNVANSSAGASGSFDPNDGARCWAR